MSHKKGETTTYYKYIGVASNDKFPDAEKTAREAQILAQHDGWDTLLSEHEDAWAKILTEDSIDDFTDPITGELPDDPNIRDLQIASISSPFYLLQNLQPDGSGLDDNSIVVGGLASESYGGLVFWDADYWMAPGLNLAFPGWANQISNYRVKQLPQAKANAVFNNYPNGSALYSWTSGRYGNCTGTGPCVDYQYHLNPDIAFNILQQYNITQNDTWFNTGPKDLVYSIATAHSHLLEYNETTKTYWLHNGSDPDEYANNVNNTAFTIASTSKLLQTANLLRVADGLPKIDLWDDQAAKIAFPQTPSGITREYDGMNNTVAVKQADTVLQTYPLDFTQNYNLTNRLADVDYVRLSPPSLANLVSPLTCLVCESPIPQRPSNDLLHLRHRRQRSFPLWLLSQHIHPERRNPLPPRPMVPILRARSRRFRYEWGHEPCISFPHWSWWILSSRSFWLPGCTD
jgi:trehalose/maltose hydrolase-like predicted phosphorylase